MKIVEEFTRSLLVPQLRSLGLSKRQWEIVVDDVTKRLESALSHWNDEPFRRTILLLGTEEAFFWEPRTANLEIRALVAVAVRNSLLTDLNADKAYTRELRSRKELLPDERMPWITSAAIKYYEAVNLDNVRVQAGRDLFGGFPVRFPNAWHVLSLLGNASETEITCELPMAEAEPMTLSVSRRRLQTRTVVESGIDPGLDDFLTDALAQIERGELDLFFSSAFKGITRNPEKLLSIIDYILRHGATLLTPNYLLSPTYLARRNPPLRPAHHTAEIAAQIANAEGLSARHQELLRSLIQSR